MAYILKTEKQVSVIAALAKGMSIRAAERMTGVHRDTIMRLGVKVGEACTGLMDGTTRDLNSEKLQLVEIWGFVGKKQENVSRVDSEEYVDAVERGFGSEVDYGQIVKSYSSTEMAERRYSPPKIVDVSKLAIARNPDIAHVSTSYIESQNLTMRMHCRRLTRLTNAFSKKLENFKAAIGLHFGYYNFVKIHKTLRATPAMAAGVAPSFWTVADLVEMANQT